MGRRQRRTILLIMFLSVAACLVGLILQTKVNPLTEELAVAKINDLASNLINQAVGSRSKKEMYNMRTLCSFSRTHRET